MQVKCSICGANAKDRPGKARSGKELTLWHCAECNFDFLAHDPSRDLAANKLDESRLKAAGLDIPTRDRDFANGLAQSQPYVTEYLEPADKGRGVLEIGCSWGYFLKLVDDYGAKPHGVELNTLRAEYVNDGLKIPCDVTLEACEARGLKFRKIFLFYVLEYVPDPLAYLKRLVAMLEEGGSLIVVTPNLDDAIKDVWRNEAFGRFFYDEHAINYMSQRSVERLVERLPASDRKVIARQGYSFVNHVSWYLTNAPRTTGVVGGDNFIRDIVVRLRETGASDSRPAGVARELADLIGRFDSEYRRVLESHQFGNQVRFIVRR